MRHIVGELCPLVLYQLDRRDGNTTARQKAVDELWYGRWRAIFNADRWRRPSGAQQG